MNILFRADSSSTIGTGHIMRDLVLAEEFENSNIIFAMKELAGNINHKVKEKGYMVEILNSDNIKEIINVIKKHSIDMIIIDHYGINHNYEKILKELTGINIFLLDDTYEKHNCDILLNHNIYADSSRYKKLVPEHCELRCGSEFTLLRNEFRVEKNKPRKYSKKIKHIFIAMGGADHSNQNIKILKVLKDFSNIHIHVVTTTANKHLYKLKTYVKDEKNIILHVNTSNIAKLMNEADFAIVTPSVILNEIIYLNIPFVAIKTAENQNEMYKFLKKDGKAVLKEFNITDLKNKIKQFLDNDNIELVNFIDLSLNEKKMVLAWRNHPEIRKWMFTPDIIELDAHLSYVDSLINRKDRAYFLVKKGSQAIGVIDFTNIDYNNKTTEFGIYSNPDLRGVGNILMQTIITYAFEVLNVIKLISVVIKENISAIKLYNRYDFKTITTKQINNKNITYMELKNENRKV